MSKEENQNIPDKLLEELPTKTAIDKYDSDEMILCQNCNRSNPPNRLDCLYCGQKLVISDAQRQNLRPVLRKTDPWKNALNLVFTSKSEPLDDSDINDVAKMTRLEPESITEILKVGNLPIARSEQVSEVGIVDERLREIGLETKVIEDKAFQAGKPPRRLSAIEFVENGISLSLFGKGEKKTVGADELCLIVSGAIFERRVEATEKHSKKDDNKIVDAAETSMDEMLVDIYSSEDGIGFRVSANGFDFSCLGEEKTMLANENIKRLVTKLRRAAPDARFVDDYVEIRGLLGLVWDVDEITDSKGLKRKSFGGYNREVVTTTSNTSQFTKYSRLCWLLK